MKKMLAVAASFVLLGSGAALAGPYTGDGIQGFIDGAVNPVFQGWATGVVDYTPFDLAEIQNYVGGAYADPTKALGAVTGSNVDIVSLGDMDATEIAAYQAGTGAGPGEITLSFDTGISNGAGFDFAVFENGFWDTSAGTFFAELGYVEVSTNGTDFARFGSVSLTSGLVGAYGGIDPTDVSNLAGKHPNAYGTSEGTGFDLADLASSSLVLAGLVDLDDINYVKIVDIPGSGDFTDSLGNPVYDAWPTWGSGGVDLEAVGVIHTAAVPVPAAVWLLGSGLFGLIGIRGRKGTNH